MEERQITVAGTTHQLPDLFLVMATQNPVEQGGCRRPRWCNMSRPMPSTLNSSASSPRSGSKGKPFAPDARMKKILVEGVAIGNATARSITFRPRYQSAYFYPGKRQWYSSFAGGSSEFMNNGELVLDDRIMFHYYATGITPAMAMPKVGTGSAYEMGVHDSEGRYFDGGKTYKCMLPAPIPAKDFWSFMVYDSQARSVLETDQKSGGLDSDNPSVKPNADGSSTMWFGPKVPAGHEGNWIQTMPGKSYNILLRLYGPLHPWFSKTWMPGDLELVKSK